MTEMTGKTTLGLYRSIHKTTPGHDNGTIVDGAAVTGVLYPDFERREIRKRGRHDGHGRDEGCAGQSGSQRGGAPDRPRRDGSPARQGLSAS